MILKQMPIFAALLFLLSINCVADSIRISQVDSSDLLLRQQVKLYLSVTDDQGIPIPDVKKEELSILESANGRVFNAVEDIYGFQKGINYADGVSFLLLIDNSESMYWTMEGEQTNEEAQRRMTIVKKAIRSFLRSITNPNDKVGVAVYNSYYRLLSEPSGAIESVENQLDSITRPKGDAIYTEIYASLELAVKELDMIKGRKAIVILSDGVNNPAYAHTKKINEQFGRKFTPFSKPLEQLQLEGISLYVINFGSKTDKKDRQLITIAQQSGGVTFDAHNQNELNQVYTKIINQVQKEYVATYRASMELADKKHVKVIYRKGDNKDSVSRTYLSGSVFGQPSKSFNPLFLISILLSALLLWLLSKIKFEKQRKTPSLEVLNAGAGKVMTQVISLGSDETIIGSSPEADMTIIGLPAVKENHATVIFDSSANRYTLRGNGKMLVNNQVVTTKILEPGDLINIDGTTMVFDEGSAAEKKK